jgi:mRNA interferase HigB
MEHDYRNHVISYKRINEFLETHPDHGGCRDALNAWYGTIVQAQWMNFAQVRGTYGHASQVGRYVVFNVAGNKIRIVTEIRYNFKPRIIYLRHVLTHAEYDKLDLTE